MKTIGILLSLLLGTSAMASTSDACLNVLEKKYQQDAKQSSDWGYDGISSLSKKDAKAMIKDALPDDGEKKRAQIAALLSDKNILFYTLQWNAPSNTGTTILAADVRTCTVVADLLYWSEE